MKLSTTRICTYRILGIVAAVLLMLCLMGSCSRPAFAMGSMTIECAAVQNDGKTMDDLWADVSDSNDSAPVDGVNEAVNDIQGKYEDAMGQAQKALHIKKICTVLTYCFMIAFLISLFAAIFIMVKQMVFPVWPVVAMAGFLILVAVSGIIVPRMM